MHSALFGSAVTSTSMGQTREHLPHPVHFAPSTDMRYSAKRLNSP